MSSRYPPKKRLVILPRYFQRDLPSSIVFFPGVASFVLVIVRVIRQGGANYIGDRERSRPTTIEIVHRLSRPSNRPWTGSLTPFSFTLAFALPCPPRGDRNLFSITPLSLSIRSATLSSLPPVPTLVVLGRNKKVSLSFALPRSIKDNERTNAFMLSKSFFGLFLFFFFFKNISPGTRRVEGSFETLCFRFAFPFRSSNTFPCQLFAPPLVAALKLQPSQIVRDARRRFRDALYPFYEKTIR